MKRILTAILGLLFSASAWASTYADIWWNPSESGWGVTFSQQQTTIFATFFIYGIDGKPYWVTSVLSASASKPTEFNGPVFTVTGSPYTEVFDPTKTNAQQVGTARVLFTSGVRATLSYSINGTQITKSIERQSLVAVPLAGKYSGKTLFRDSLLSDISGLETFSAQSAEFTVSVASNSLTIRRESTANAVCMYAGTFTQHGSRFAASGTYQCSDFSTGTWATTDLTIFDGAYLLGTIQSIRTAPTPSAAFSQQWMGGRVGTL